MGQDSLIYLLFGVYIFGSILLTIFAWMVQKSKPSKKYKHIKKMVAPDYYKPIKKTDLTKATAYMIGKINPKRKLEID